jgi:hypothetical protein
MHVKDSSKSIERTVRQEKMYRRLIMDRCCRWEQATDKIITSRIPVIKFTLIFKNAYIRETPL